MNATRKYLLALTLLCASSFSPALQAAQEQAPSPHKPIVMAVFDQDCKIWCNQIHPVLNKLQKQYATKVVFLELDATGAHLERSRMQAKRLGLMQYFNDALDYVPVVVVFDGNAKVVKELSGPKKQTEYSAAIDKALARR